MLSWLVRRVVKDAWFVVVTWAVLAIVLLTASLGILGGRGLFERLEAGTLSVGGTESAQGDQIISVLSGDGRIVTLMVEGIDISSPEAQAQVTEALGPAHTELASLAGATNVFDPFNVRRSLYASAVRSFGSDRLDGFLVVVSVDPNGTEVASPDDQAYAAEVDRIVERVEDRLRQIPGELSSISPQVSGIVSDDALKTDAVNDQARRDLLPAVLIAVLAPLVMMILILGRVRAAAAPALGALVSLAGSLGILWALSLMMKVQAGTVGVITAVGLSLSIGYGLLIACRYQEELVSAQREEALDTGEGEIVAGAHRRPRPGRRSSLLVPAMQAAVSTTGRTMILSGVLVAACMIPLLLMGSDALRATGLAGIAVVLLCVTVSLTAVPAVLSLLGEAMRRPTILQRATAALRSPRPGQGAVREEGVFSRLASLIHRLPWVVLVAGAVLLVILASPARHLHMLTSTDDLLPAGSDQQAYRQMLLEHYPVAGQQEDAAVVIAGTGENVTNFINSKIATTPGVDKIQRTATAGKYTVAYLDLAGPASGGQAEAAVRSLRALEAPADTWVTGQAASQVDFADAVVRSLLAVGAAMLTVLVMLCLVTGSILVPVKTLIVNVLSVAASLGMVVWVFQQGHAAGLLGFTPLGGVEAYAVVTAACAGLGLSTGYSVFSLGRIKERWQEGYDNNRAVELGLQRSGRTLTSMALVMTAVFLGFVTGKTLIVKEAALILALTVVIDAVVVRVLLLPAAMALLGRWNWWMPRALRQPNGRYDPEPTAAQAAAAGAIAVGAAGDAATGAAVGAAGTAAGDAGAAGTSDAAAAGAGYAEGDHDAFTGPGAAEPITAAGPGAAEPADWAAAPVEPAAPPDWSDRAGPEASADASAFDDWQAASADGSAPLYGSAPVGSPAAPDWQAPDDWAAASDGGPAAPADGSAPVYGSGPEGGPAVPDWQASIDFPGPDGPAAPSDWSVPAPADGSAPARPWSPDQPHEADAPRDADRADRDLEEAQWATGASPATADWSAEPLVAPVDFSAAADPLALPDWSISTDPAAAPGSAPAAEDSAIDDTLSTSGPLATEDTLATSGPLATGGPSATDWSVPTGPWTPDQPQEAGVGYGGVGEDDWDPEGTEQAADDQDRRYGPNPHLAADETDPPWKGRPE